MLRITKQTDYGIVLLTRIAGENAASLLSAKDLSVDAGIPLPTVSKILKTLVRGGLLTSQRGVHGGYGLAGPADRLRLAEVIACLEGPIAMTECSEEGSGTCRIQSSCQVRVNWQLINRAVYEALSRITLADMVRPAQSMRSVLAESGPGGRSSAESGCHEVSLQETRR